MSNLSTRRATGLLLAASLAAACEPSHSSPRTSSNLNDGKNTTMKTRILIAMTSHDQKGSTGTPTGAYLPEIAHPYSVFTKAGYEVEFASPKGGKVPLDGVDLEDSINAAFMGDPKTVARLNDSIASRDVLPARYQAIFFAGGHGAMWDLPGDEPFKVATARIYEAGGIVAAVCHGPAALVDVKLSNGNYLVANKDVSAFTNDEERTVKLDAVVPFLLEDKLVAHGARHQPAPNWQQKVVVSERLVTGQNPASASGVAEAVVSVLQRASTISGSASK